MIDEAFVVVVVVVVVVCLRPFLCTRSHIILFFNYFFLTQNRKRILHEGVGQPFFVKGSTHAYSSLVELVEHCRELSLVIACGKDTQSWGYLDKPDD